MNSEERLKKLFGASSEQLAVIDSILEGKTLNAPEPTGPLLMKVGKSAKFLGVSRTTFWRIRKKRELQKVEVLPGSSWLRRSDLEAITEKNPFNCPPDPH